MQVIDPNVVRLASALYTNGLGSHTATRRRRSGVHGDVLARKSPPTRRRRSQANNLRRSALRRSVGESRALHTRYS